MSGVVFSLSGFQNPYRSELRSKALEMGAKYKDNWTTDCTHLICAFVNTPKYKTVSTAKGKIVSKEWVLNSHKTKKLLPWKDYILGDKKASNSSNSSSFTSTPATSSGINRANAKKEATKKIHTSIKAMESDNSGMDDSEDTDDDPLYNADTDVDTEIDSDHEKGEKENSDYDTEDEIERLKTNQKKTLTKGKSKSPIRIKKEDTSSEEEDDDNNENQNQRLPKKQPKTETRIDTFELPLPDLPNLFKNKGFFLYGSFPQAERKTLERYIIGYGGDLENYMGENVKYVITQEQWDDQFEEALTENDNLVFVKPGWILKCADQEKFIPYQPFIIVPSE